MLRLKSLRLQLIAGFLIVTLIPLAASGVYGHFFTSQALSQQALERSTYQVHLQAESILSALRQVQGDALYLGELRSLNMLHQQTSADQISLWRSEVSQDLLVLASVRPMYHAIRIIDDDGTQVAGVIADDAHVSVMEARSQLSGQPYFRAAMDLQGGEVYVSNFQSQDSEGSPYLHYVMRMRDGVLVIDVLVGWLVRSLPENPGQDLWAVLDQDGQFLVYPRGFDPQSVAMDIPTLINGGSGSIQNANGVLVYDTLYPTTQEVADDAHDPFWVILRHTPTGVLFASVNDFYHVVLLVGVGAALMALVLAIVISDVLVGPVRRLREMTIRFGKTGVAPSVPYHLPNGEIGTLTKTFLDIAHELEVKRRKEHRLIEQLIRAQEEERKLVAYDLHDGLIQQLVGARFYFTNSRNTTCMTENVDVRTDIERGCEALSEAIIEGRRIIEGLRPAALDDLGLAAAVQEIAEQTAAAAGWELTLDIQPLPTEPEKMIAVTVYRIAQEALNNARKHAKAGHVKICLHNGNGVNLSINDDGVGFDIRALSGDGHGLGITTMQERASLINGVCKINSTPGEGTRVDVNVPSVLNIAPEMGEKVLA